MSLSFKYKSQDGSNTKESGLRTHISAACLNSQCLEECDYSGRWQTGVFQWIQGFLDARDACELFSLRCGIWRESDYFAFLNMIRARHVLDTRVMPAGPELVGTTSVTSRQVREKREKSMHQALFETWHELDNRGESVESPCCPLMLKVEPWGPDTWWLLLLLGSDGVCLTCPILFA